jgi:hypothetical protein
MTEKAITEKYFKSIDPKGNTKKMDGVIEYSNWGLGSVFVEDDNAIIRINKNLPKWKTLYVHVLEHENAHIAEYKKKKKIITLKNFFYELTGDFDIKIIASFIAFYLRYPKSLSDFCPIQLWKGRIIVYPFVLVVYAVISMLMVTKSI